MAVRFALSDGSPGHSFFSLSLNRSSLLFLLSLSLSLSFDSNSRAILARDRSSGVHTALVSSRGRIVGRSVGRSVRLFVGR